MNFKHYTYLIFVLAITVAGCKKPYGPKITSANVNYLVVEGVINSGQDSTTIKLSRTVNVADTIKANPEYGAQVTVEGDDGTTYPLQDMGNGNYASPSLNLNNSQQYQLHIKSQNGKEYLSDFVPLKLNPPIDSVGYVQKSGGIDLYVNTHDASNSTRYYRWSYQETWQFHSKYGTNFITDGTQLLPRQPNQQIFTCFGNRASTTILLGSSAKLSHDLIYQSPITSVGSTSEKLEAKYSILVKQYALTPEAYSFWQTLKKNTEDLGSIFSSQPSEIHGNIHCTTDPSEPVVGYISITNVQQKRIFISHDQLPDSWVATYPYQCTLDSLLLCHGPSCQNDVAIFLLPLNTTEFAIVPLETKGKVFGYLSTDAQCADCTIRGSNKQPSFWR